MTQASQVSPSAAGVAQRGMTFSVDGWDPSYGASLELEGQLAESTARIDASVEVLAGRWPRIDQDHAASLPEALLFVDALRRVEAQLWIDADARAVGGRAVDATTGEVHPDDGPGGGAATEATAAVCASYAAAAV